MGAITVAGGDSFQPHPPGGMLAGPPKQWVEDLLPLVLEEGISAFILTSDDPETMRRFAVEVVPSLRERVAAERVPAR